LSATHVCADPPSMLVSIDRKTSALAAVLHGRHFAINYLGRDASLPRRFANRNVGHYDQPQGKSGALSSGSEHRGAEDGSALLRVMPSPTFAHALSTSK
jgi:flavin reductase (DIM6/NTAB) family NADH-FMN oxidoreductase RutF